MQERPSPDTDLELLGEELLRVVRAQKDALRADRFDALTGLTQQRKQTYTILATAIEEARATGKTVPATRLTEIANEISTIDEITKALIDVVLRQNADSMRQVQQESKALNYQRRPGQIRVSTVDMKR